MNEGEKLSAEEIRRKRKEKILARMAAEKAQKQPSSQQPSLTQNPSSQLKSQPPEQLSKTALQTFKLERQFSHFMENYQLYGKMLGIVLYLLNFLTQGIPLLILICLPVLIIIPFLKKPAELAEWSQKHKIQVLEKVPGVDKFSKLWQIASFIQPGLQCMSTYFLSAIVFSAFM